MSNNGKIGMDNGSLLRESYHPDFFDILYKGRGNQDCIRLKERASWRGFAIQNILLPSALAGSAWDRRTRHEDLDLSPAPDA